MELQKARVALRVENKVRDPVRAAAAVGKEILGQWPTIRNPNGRL